ncbi:Transposase DDE domain group 1 [Neomoorella glycerini]|uniref:Transposase DDE domain group 1 n=1 Tax=Neomoorella glycerini TaxID=55779 RepID=A0A6I5ZQD2_9FIRM|nr:Transposase DDE domain group 1 [Moorella glycerini]
MEEMARFLKDLKAPVTPVTLGSGELKRQYVPLDIDVSPFDNSNSKKEGVSRAGKQHCQKGTPEFLRQALTFARAITSLPLLVHMDGGNDSQDNLQVCLDPKVKADFIIKRNLRKETPEAWLAIAVDNIIALYHDHGTSEQFHSEIKNDLDLERLPSGKFATNDLVLHLGIFAYNILRLLGQFSLPLKEVPLRNKKAQRRRLRTVIQNLITIASRLVRHARQVKLRFGQHSPWYPAFRQLYRALA